MTLPGHPQTRSGLKPYYLLWGFRKCGTTTLARSMARSGIAMPPWEESNIWVARPDDIPGLLQELWRDRQDAPYFVDLSTLTHLGKSNHVEVLRAFGCTPCYVVCTRPAGPRWVSAFTHMVRKKADARSLGSYMALYEDFIGLSRADLRELEDEIIRRDLERGVKTPAGVIGPEYFSTSYPMPFVADPVDPLYQFRYFGETLDMLEKRPPAFVELPLDRPETTTRWLAQEFDVTAVPPGDEVLNRNSVFNAVRHHPAVARVTRHIPRALRHGVALRLETSRLLPKVSHNTGDSGLERAMAQLVAEMLGACGDDGEGQRA